MCDLELYSHFFLCLIVFGRSALSAVVFSSRFFLWLRMCSLLSSFSSLSFSGCGSVNCGGQLVRFEGLVKMGRGTGADQHAGDAGPAEYPREGEVNH